jgi:hypothetical protein
MLLQRHQYEADALKASQLLEWADEIGIAYPDPASFPKVLCTGQYMCGTTWGGMQLYTTLSSKATFFFWKNGFAECGW